MIYFKEMTISTSIHVASNGIISFTSMAKKFSFLEATWQYLSKKECKHFHLVFSIPEM